MSLQESPALSGPGTGHGGAATTLHTVFRFLRTVRLRSGILLTALIAAGICSAAYYVTAERRYESRAQLHIVRKGSGVTEDAGKNGNPSLEMPTFQKLMSSNEVVLRAISRLPRKYRVDLAGLADRQWVGEIQRNLTVSSSFGTTVLDLSYRSRDPRAAQMVLGALLDAYKHYMNETHQDSSEENLMTLQAKLEELTDQLRQKTQERLQLKASAPDLVDGGTDTGSLNVAVEQVRFLTGELSKAREETANARSMHNSIQFAVSQNEDILQYALKSVDAVGRQLIEQSLGLGTQDAMVVARVNQDLLDLHAQLTDAQTRYGTSHPYLKSLTEKIRVKERYLQELPLVQRRNLQQMAREHLAPQLLTMAEQRKRTSEQHELELRERLLDEQSRATALSQTLTRLGDLNREIDQLYHLRDSIQEHMSNIDLNKNKSISTTVSARPSISLRPVSPRLVIIALLALVTGSVGGLAIIWVLDIMDDRFRTPEELKLQLETQVLSMIPRMDELPGEGFAAVVCHARPHSRDVEAFRALRTAVEFSPQETNRLVVTSTEPGDGKTTVSSNLAVAYAQSGKKTLIIDADMRRPGLSTLLGLRDDVGLSRILRAEDDLETATLRNVRQSCVPGLDVISCGPRPVNPAELLSSERFANLLAWAETKYDQIVVDAPPVLAVSDPTIVGRLVDAVVLVVRPDKDRRRMVIRAVESLRTLGSTLLGVVVNHLTTIDAGGYGYGYGYGYGHDHEHDEHPEKDVARGLSALAAGTPPPDTPKRSRRAA